MLHLGPVLMRRRVGASVHATVTQDTTVLDAQVLNIKRLFRLIFDPQCSMRELRGILQLRQSEHSYRWKLCNGMQCGRHGVLGFVFDFESFQKPESPIEFCRPVAMWRRPVLLRWRCQAFGQQRLLFNADIQLGANTQLADDLSSL